MVLKRDLFTFSRERARVSAAQLCAPNRALCLSLSCWIVVSFMSKGKGHPITGHEGPTGGVEVQPYSFSTSALGGCGWSAPRPDRFTPGKYPVPIIQEAGWAPGPVWTCAKNLAPTGIGSPDRPARSSFTSRERNTKIHTLTLSERFNRLTVTKLHMTVTAAKMSGTVLKRN
jgi:hypothetical protein